MTTTDPTAILGLVDRYGALVYSAPIEAECGRPVEADRMEAEAAALRVQIEAALNVRTASPDMACQPTAAQALREAADLVDRGPDIPLPPSIYSALLRERADDLDTGDWPDDRYQPAA